MKLKTVIFFVLLALLPVGYFSQNARVPKLLANSQNLYSKIKIFTSILETIQRSYVEQRDPDDLLEAAIRGVVSNLDPHTVYLPADDFKAWNQSFEGYTGIGISFEVLREQVTVMTVLDDSPADEAGIRRGDKIQKINGASAVGLSRDKVSEMFHGPAGAPIELQVVRPRWQRPRNFGLIRKKIVLDSVPYAMMLANRIGYVKIDRFTSTTARELDHALSELEKKGMTNLVLDLRGNAGGYLNAAVAVADRFIPGGHKLLTTKGRLSSSFQEFHSTNEKTRRQYPLVVLIDHGSASAAEIVAGAIQDLDRGLIVGKTSFGKGLVQSQYRFHDGSALLITTARYYTPSGRLIQRNFYDRSKDEYYWEAYDDSLSKARKQEDKTTYRTYLGRRVYAKGGIKPDIWVENDDNILSEEVRRLYFSNKRFFYVFAEDYLKRFPHLRKSEDTFVKNYSISHAALKQFVRFVRNYDPSFSDAHLVNEKNTRDIKFLLKRDMAYMIWGNNARFRINLRRDRQLGEAVKHLHAAHKLLSLTVSMD